LKEPCFNQLRTKEQLGYIVFTQFFSVNKVLGGLIIVQSSKYGASYLEERINSFLHQVKGQGGFTAETVEAIKLSQIQNLK